MAERYVIDASVAAKWFPKDGSEDHVDLAEEVLADGLTGNIELHTTGKIEERLDAAESGLLVASRFDFAMRPGRRQPYREVQDLLETRFAVADPAPSIGATAI